MDAGRDVILLTGAPSFEQLSWSEDVLLPCEIILDWLTKASSTIWPPINNTSSPRWRVISSDPCLVSAEGSVLSQMHFLDLTLVGNAGSAEQHDLLDQTEALLETSADISFSSDKIHLDPETEQRAATISFYSALSDTDLAVDLQSSTRKETAVLESMTVTDLVNLPSAARLSALMPQTITLNLLVGIIELRPPRSVNLRRSKLEMQIIDLTVGDETKSGFGISVWLVPEHIEQCRTQALRKQIQALRAGDLVLFQNLALHSFRACVYGQTLGRRTLTAGTSVIRIDDNAALHPSLSDKAKRVSVWADRFVGRTASRRKYDNARTLADELPPETQ